MSKNPGVKRSVSLEIPRFEQVEQLAEEWRSITSMARDAMHLESWVMKLMIGRATVQHPLYSKNAKGNASLIEEASKIALMDSKRVYECVSAYVSNVKEDEDVYKLAGRLQAEYGTFKALVRGDDSARTETKVNCNGKCPNHCK